ncbi:MAG: hypothetical protein JSW49_08450 [candidate division WOR-3 bacterium]|nr:MAG: hypothetical protein JSW49_08450 [candidate division WOR-3 bacterium]
MKIFRSYANRGQRVAVFVVIMTSFLLWGISCNDGRYGEIVDYRKGMSIPSWQSHEYLDSRVIESMLALSETGADYIAIVPTWYQESAQGDSIYPTASTPVDSAVIHVINEARALGYGVMLKPHVDVEDGTFRGDIFPADIDSWFGSYEQFILHNAGIAQLTGVEIFCIGTEFKRLSSRSEWIDIIASVKSIYDGMTVYAANWDEYPSVSFWEYLDYVGIDAYFPLARDREATIEEYLQNFELWLFQIDNYQSSVGKDIIITEVGFRSVRGCAVEPYEWQEDGIMDEESQADAYRTILATLQRKQWLEGIFFWQWDPILSEDSIGYTPYSKLAEDVLREFWVE